MDHYTELSIEASQEIQELLVAELSELHFDNFTQEENSLMAYALTSHYEDAKEEIHELITRYGAKLLGVKDIENNINWNQQWEDSFEPIIIGEEIFVRAAFHAPREGFKHQIIIQPKMSFGTGHHETTQLMMELMLEHDFNGAACLDMGCGTGVLAILGEQLGAAYTMAIDYDEWCYENTQENFELNNMSHASVVHGDVKVLAEEEFLQEWLPYQHRIILSNITKNYNLENLGMYHNISQPGTVIQISGFYETDLQDLRNEAEKYGMKFVKSKTKNNWCAAVFIQQ